MAKKKKDGQEPRKKDAEKAELPRTLKSALGADYSSVLQMRNVQWLIVIASVVAAMLLGYYLSAVFVPLLVALALAYMLNPLVVKLEKRGIRRKRAVLLIFIAFIALGAAVGSWFTASVVTDVTNLSQQARGIWDEFRENQHDWFVSYNEAVPENLQVDPDEDAFGEAGAYVINQLFPPESVAEPPESALARADMAQARADLLASFRADDADGDLRLTSDEVAPAIITSMDEDGDGAVSTNEWFVHFGATAPESDGRTVSQRTSGATSTLIGLAGSGLMGLLTLILFVVLVPIYTWYFMIGWEAVVDQGKAYLPGRHRKRILDILGEIDAMLKAFFRGRLAIVVIITVLTTLTYVLFGVQYAVLLGLLGGFGVLIPYAAMLISWVPALILMGIDGDPVWMLIGMSVCFHAIQSIEQFVLTPWLLGDAVELHPVTIIVGVFVMASLFGLFGALLAVPLTAIAKTLGREFLLPYFKNLANEKPPDT